MDPSFPPLILLDAQSALTERASGTQEESEEEKEDADADTESSEQPKSAAVTQSTLIPLSIVSAGALIGAALLMVA